MTHKNPSNPIDILKKSVLTACVAAGLGLVAAPSMAQQANDSSAQAADEETDRIAVTGTRRRDRSIADSAVPIDVISSEALTETGLTETNAILARLLPSFNFPRPSITDGTDQIRPAQLRGLAPDQTLVLVNGKRRHTSALLNLNGSVGRGSAAVDLNMIPPNAIERIEVLRDGAAAQYGSDAIAGVINIVLKQSAARFNASATYGEHRTTVDGVPSPGPVSVGPDGDLVIEEGDDRYAKDGQTTTLQFGGGFDIGNSGYFNLAVQYRERDKTNRSGFDPRQNFPSVDGGFDEREFTFDRINHRFGDPNTEEMAIFFNSAVEMSNGWEFYSFGNYANREGDAGGFYRRGLDGRNVPEIYPAGFLPLITTDTDDMSIAGGFRGEVNDWILDTSLTYGSNELDFGVINSLNTSLGPSSQTEFEAGTLTNSQVVFNADASKLYDFNGMPTNVAVGFEYRDEEYEIGAGEPNSYVDGPFPGAAGSQVFPGFSPSSEVTGSRDNMSVYAELDADVTSRFNAAAAIRFEDYSDFGSTVIGKLAGRYQASDALAFRGSVSTGFRAPSLAQQFFTSVATVFVDGVPTETGTFRPDSDVAQALGSPGLEEETSQSYSVGFVWQPVDRASVSVDIFRIDIDDRIVLSENLSGPGIVSLLEGTGANRARFFLNGIDSTTEGIDIVGSYSVSLDDYGTVDFTAGYNYTNNDVTKVLAPPAQLAQVGVTEDNLFSRRERVRFEKGAPEDKLNLGATWRFQDFRVTTQATRFGKTVDVSTSPAGDEVLDAKTIVDLELGYELTPSIKLAFGANNLFDVYPDTAQEINDKAGQSTFTFDRIFPYSGFSAFGFNGRFLYTRIGFEY
ncbi:MAG: TonB-dependent receptor [Wenzhouxiangella sp.]|nr:TonB-dependent receptor [Wenzhouxiangella sp.]